MLLNSFSHIVFGSLPEPEENIPFAYGGAVAPTSAAVVIKPTEQYAFYFPINTSAIVFTSSNVDFVHHKTLIAPLSNIGTITNVPVSQTLNHYKVSFLIPNLPNLVFDGYWRLRLTTSAGFVYSNRLLLKMSGAETISNLFSYANINPVGPIAWDLAGMANFRQVLRLKCTIEKPKPQTEVTSYQEESTGVIRTVEITTNRYTVFSCPYVDAYADDGWTTLLSHKSLLVNAVSMGLKTGYTIKDEMNAVEGHATFELWNNAFSIINRC